MNSKYPDGTMGESERRAPISRLAFQGLPLDGVRTVLTPWSLHPIFQKVNISKPLTVVSGLGIRRGPNDEIDKGW